jgi:hypothetical protein
LFRRVGRHSPKAGGGGQNKILEGEVAAFFEFPCFPEEERKVEGKSPKHLTPVENYEGLSKKSMIFLVLDY